MYGTRTAQRLHAGLTETDVSDLALLLELYEGTHGVLNWCVLVDAMGEIQIDVCGVEFCEGGVCTFDNTVVDPNIVRSHYFLQENAPIEASSRLTTTGHRARY